MEIKRRVEDLSKVIDKQWQVNNNNYNQVKELNNNRKEHFNKMFNIKDKETRDKEIRDANSIEGRLKRLSENMKASSGNELLRNRNNFRWYYGRFI